MSHIDLRIAARVPTQYVPARVVFPGEPAHRFAKSAAHSAIDPHPRIVGATLAEPGRVDPGRARGKVTPWLCAAKAGGNALLEQIQTRTFITGRPPCLWRFYRGSIGRRTEKLCSGDASEQRWTFLSSNANMRFPSKVGAFSAVLTLWYAAVCACSKSACSTISRSASGDGTPAPPHMRLQCTLHAACTRLASPASPRPPRCSDESLHPRQPRCDVLCVAHRRTSVQHAAGDRLQPRVKLLSAYAMVHAVIAAALRPHGQLRLCIPTGLVGVPSARTGTACALPTTRSRARSASCSPFRSVLRSARVAAALTRASLSRFTRSRNSAPRAATAALNVATASA
eukprot:1469504-Prymnesium_polylepis.2